MFYVHDKDNISNVLLTPQYGEFLETFVQLLYLSDLCFGLLNTDDDYDDDNNNNSIQFNSGLL
jgi:hypothetical protein